MKSKELFQDLISDWPVKVLSLSIAVLVFFFHKINTLEQRAFSVPLSIESSEKYLVVSSYPKTVRVVIRGESTVILAVSENDIQAYLDLANVSKEGDQKFPVMVKKLGTALTAGDIEISVDPMSVVLDVERKITKTVEVKPVLVGTPVPGYEVTSSKVTPEAVTLEGPSSKVSNLHSVLTSDIDLSERSDAFTVRVRITAPSDLVRFTGGEWVEYRGIVEKTLSVRTFETIPVQVVDLTQGFELATEAVFGTALVQGTKTAIEALDGTEVTLQVDGSGISEPGSYELPVVFSAPEGVSAYSYSPDTIVFEFRVKAEESISEVDSAEPEGLEPTSADAVSSDASPGSETGEPSASVEESEGTGSVPDSATGSGR